MRIVHVKTVHLWKLTILIFCHHIAFSVTVYHCSMLSATATSSRYLMDIFDCYIINSCSSLNKPAKKLYTLSRSSVVNFWVAVTKIYSYKHHCHQAKHSTHKRIYSENKRADETSSSTKIVHLLIIQMGIRFRLEGWQKNHWGC